ncbi:hypothetical protein ACIRPS_13130 [Streptomyces griseoviridis]
MARDDGSGGGRAPYVGLSAFRTEDADSFVGRERLVEEVARRLREHRFVAAHAAFPARERFPVPLVRNDHRHPDPVQVVRHPRGPEPGGQVAVEVPLGLDGAPLIAVAHLDAVRQPHPQALRARAVDRGKQSGAAIRWQRGEVLLVGVGRDRLLQAGAEPGPVSVLPGPADVVDAVREGALRRAVRHDPEKEPLLLQAVPLKELLGDVEGFGFAGEVKGVTGLTGTLCRRACLGMLLPSRN